MGTDRSDEIRTEILLSRQRGWAARLRYAAGLLDQSPASAIIEEVCREMEPRVLPEAAAKTAISQADRERDTIRPPTPSGGGTGQRGSEAGCYA